MSEDPLTYGDDKCLGQVAPSLELLEFIRGDKIDLQPGKVHVLVFFVTFYKGAFSVHEEFSKLYEQFGKDATFIGISNDAEKEKAEKYLTKEIVDENTKAPLRFILPYVGYDANKATGKMYASLSGSTVLSCPHAFIINKDGKVVWRQAFTQSYTLAKSSFEAQLVKVIATGEAELPAARPKVEVEGEAADIPDEMSLF